MCKVTRNIPTTKDGTCIELLPADTFFVQNHKNARINLLFKVHGVFRSYLEEVKYPIFVTPVTDIKNALYLGIYSLWTFSTETDYLSHSLDKHVASPQYVSSHVAAGLNPSWTHVRKRHSHRVSPSYGVSCVPSGVRCWTTCDRLRIGISLALPSPLGALPPYGDRKALAVSCRLRHSVCRWKLDLLTKATYNILVIICSVDKL